TTSTNSAPDLSRLGDGKRERCRRSLQPPASLLQGGEDEDGRTGGVGGGMPSAGGAFLRPAGGVGGRGDCGPHLLPAGRGSRRPSPLCPVSAPPAGGRQHRAPCPQGGLCRPVRRAGRTPCLPLRLGPPRRGAAPLRPD